MSRTSGNLILMTVICVVIFWMFMGLRPAPAASAIIAQVEVLCGDVPALISFRTKSDFDLDTVARLKERRVEVKDKRLYLNGKLCEVTWPVLK